MTTQTMKFADNPLIADRKDNYLAVTVDSAKIIESWRGSLRAFEWITPEGQIKELSALKTEDQEQRTEIEDKIKSGQTLEKPVLGIGLLENVEIGIGRATFLVAFANGQKEIPAHIPKAHEKDFQPFLIKH